MARDDAEAVAGHYDELDAFYRGVWREELHHGLWLRGNESRDEAAANLVREVGQRLQLAASERLCDVGCGYGRAMRVLAESAGATAWGVTISPRQAEQGKAESGEAVEIRQGDWLENDLPDAGFDALMAIESLSHMVDPARAVREMARVLRPGGRAVLCCWLRLENPRHFEVRHLLDPIRRAGKLPGMGTES